ncbi:AraC family transcriptional regulator [Paenibacillus sp. 598K]|uniref:helix-turn-helix domain-containing protein n=1 Tax=Paenibacillus sp. 598K TaxID=1117987 RepID=UPI000FF93391|nr:helix-turn-helix domain-containing protein [Paenibacillus sp. 598K]GBF72480.1 AraC family transcriptional regulator [Paenibacillus sp. 598K]
MGKQQYRFIKLKEQISVDRIYSIHYNEFNKNFVYSGEQHDFWEFLYVDKGEVEITTDYSSFHLIQGDMIFYSPNEFHSLKCNRKTPPNTFIVAFGCKSEAMRFFTHKMLRLGNAERQQLSNLMEEADKLFAAPINKTINKPASARSAHPLARKDKPDFGAEQLVKIYLETLLIQLIRRSQAPPSARRLSSLPQEKGQRDLIRRIVEFLTARIAERPSIDAVCAEFALSQSHVRSLFRDHTGSGVTEYIVRLRIEHAKLHIREETYNMTEIAELLGYASLHFFSRQFKRITGMSPSEYARTVQAQT